MNEWFETHPFLKQMRRRLSVELAVCLLLFCGVFLAARYAGLASAGADAVLGKKKPVVFLDAGHGDFDPGKVSVDGSLEKDINLAIAKRLKWYLEQSDVEVVMSREDDRGLYDTSTGSRKMSDMKNRCARVEESGADLVVSIHQNSYQDAQNHGAQVFYYSHSEEGKRMAEVMQKALLKADEENTRQAKANDTYYLLKRTEVPTIIVECGFLSNPEEAAKLVSPKYQEKLAEAIAEGILACMEN